MNKPTGKNFKKPQGKDRRPGSGPPRRPSGPPREADAASSGPRKGPPDATLREAEYLKDLVADKTPVRVKLRGDESVEGVIEYYDHSMIRLTRDGEPNLFIYKADISYLEEQG